MRRSELQLLDVRRLGALAALGDLEGNLLAFVKSLEALALDRAEVHKDIVTLVGGDESVTLCCVKPFDCTVASQIVLPPNRKCFTLSCMPNKIQIKLNLVSCQVYLKKNF